MMSIKRLPLIFLLALITALTISAIGTATTPDKEPQPVTQPIPLRSDDPSMGDCYENGNLVCGDPNGLHADEAWQAWDSLGGWKYLKVDPNRRFKLDYVGTAMLPPRLGAGEVALPYNNGYLVFRATYLPLSV